MREETDRSATMSAPLGGSGPTSRRKHHVLVTGGAGFLGVNLIRYLLERGHQAASLDFAPFDYADCRDRIRIVRTPRDC